ncbi:unnamed protein product [Lampetra fluviatilis]
MGLCGGTRYENSGCDKRHRIEARGERNCEQLTSFNNETSGFEEEDDGRLPPMAEISHQGQVKPLHCKCQGQVKPLHCKCQGQVRPLHYKCQGQVKPLHYKCQG